MLEVNCDPPSLLRVFGTPKIPTQDRNALTNSKVEVLFVGYRLTNFEKLSIMIYILFSIYLLAMDPEYQSIIWREAKHYTNDDRQGLPT